MESLPFSQESRSLESAVISSIKKEENTTKNKGLTKEMSELKELKKSAMKLESRYSTMFPKVSPRLIADLLKAQRENPNKLPIFVLEVFTKKEQDGGIDADTIREHIWNTTGKMPAIYDNGTHYVTNQRLTLETLKRLNDFEHVLKVTGEYSGSGYALTSPTYGCSVKLNDIRRIEIEKGEQSLKVEQKNKEKTSALEVVLLTIIGIAGAVALGGFVVSGGILPNAHTNDDVTVISPIGHEPGMLYGHVGGPIGGLPAVGASIVAKNVETGHTSNSVISIDGKYYLDLVPGMYNVIVAFPDGTSQTYDDVPIERGTASEMNIIY
jgi:carboxypeptidase family protein